MESLNRLKDIHEKEVLGECRGGRVDGVGLVSTGGSHLDQWPKSRGQPGQGAPTHRLQT